MAPTAASSGSSSTAAKPAIIAPSAQPTPVTLVSSGWPLLTRTTRVPSVRWSTGPLIATTVPCRPASSTAASSAASGVSTDSTPLPPAPPVSAITSEALPRSTVGPAASSVPAISVRQARAPAATGSSTQGVPASVAPATACSMAAAVSA